MKEDAAADAPEEATPTDDAEWLALWRAVVRDDPHSRDAKEAAHWLRVLDAEHAERLVTERQRDEQIADKHRILQEYAARVSQLQTTIVEAHKRANRLAGLLMQDAESGDFGHGLDDRAALAVDLAADLATWERPERSSPLISERSERLRGPSPQVLAVEALTAARLSAEQETDRLRADGARLDWLLSSLMPFGTMRRFDMVRSEWHVAHPDGAFLTPENIREAIDAARRATPERPEADASDRSRSTPNASAVSTYAAAPRPEPPA